MYLNKTNVVRPNKTNVVTINTKVFTTYFYKFLKYNLQLHTTTYSSLDIFKILLKFVKILAFKH